MKHSHICTYWIGDVENGNNNNNSSIMKRKKLPAFSKYQLLNICIACAIASLQCKSKIANNLFELPSRCKKAISNYLPHTVCSLSYMAKKVLRLTFNLWTMSAWNWIFLSSVIAFIWVHSIQLLVSNVRYAISRIKKTKKTAKTTTSSFAAINFINCRVCCRYCCDFVFSGLTSVPFAIALCIIIII